MTSLDNMRHRAYYEYLNRRSLLGTFYRNRILYPYLLGITGPTFLDVGCGAGLFLAKGSESSLGLDINRFCVDSLRRKGLRACTICHDGRFPVANRSFSSVVCDQVVEHLDDPSNLIAEIERVITPNGLLLIGLPLEMGFSADPDHRHFYDLHSIVNTVQRIAPSLHYSRHFFFPLPFGLFGKFFTWQYMYVIFRN